MDADKANRFEHEKTEITEFASLLPPFPPVDEFFICVNPRQSAGTPDSVASCRLDRRSVGVFNAKAQGREGAKGFSVFASWRLGDFAMKALSYP